MTKQKMTLAEQVIALIEQTGTPIDTDAVADFSDAKAEQLLSQIAASIDEGEKEKETAPLSAERIEDVVDTIVHDSFNLFFDPEERVLGDNGKRYPLTHRFEGSDVTSTGEIVTVDKFEFLGRGMARAQCSGLAYMVRQQEKKIADQRNSIQSELRFGRNRGIDVGAKVDRMSDFLAHLIEQHALATVAFAKSCEVYTELTGDVYETREQAEASAKASYDGLDAAMKERLTKLGVTA